MIRNHLTLIAILNIESPRTSFVTYPSGKGGFSILGYRAPSSYRYLYCPAGVTWSARRRVERRVRGENNGRTFYYQIDLWISSRVPTTEVYMAASTPSCFIRRRRLADIPRAAREANVFIASRAREITRRIDTGGARESGPSYRLATALRKLPSPYTFHGTPGERRRAIP